ncbi:PcfB family protein [Acidaminobacter sp. JC074]|uniref:PcfB family protein n=1 Tax=Acidaminobacter sp. JC074 TaxID=2530199 RepID=UPI001F0D08E3|nr:PcfB family protein [Acidaminobacter sp. JC074]
MQEHVNEKTIALQIKAARFTAVELKKVLNKYLAHRKNVKRGKKAIKSVKPLGKTTLENLSRKYDGLKNIEINEKNIKDFEKVAKKYNLEYALKKDTASKPPTYFVFFKGKDLDVIDFAFKEYLKSSLAKDEDKRPSLKDRLKTMVEKSKQMDKGKEKKLDKEQSL